MGKKIKKKSCFDCGVSSTPAQGPSLIAGNIPNPLQGPTLPRLSFLHGAPSSASTANLAASPHPRTEDIVMAAHMSCGWLMQGDQLKPPSAMGQFLVGHACSHTGSHAGRHAGPPSAGTGLQGSQLSNPLLKNEAAAAVDLSRQPRASLSGGSLPHRQPISGLVADLSGEERRLAAIAILCDALGLPSGPPSRSAISGAPSFVRDGASSSSGGGTVAASLRALVGATTAARLAGTVLLRGDWCRSALMEAERQAR